MSFQMIIVLIAMTLAAIYVFRATFMTWFGKSSGCTSGCGKCGQAESTVVTGKVEKDVPVKGRISLLQ